MTDVINLSGPAFGPAAGGAAKKIVILLHGYGADGQDLIGLAPHFARVLPDAYFVSPDAPYPCEIGFGRQWFSIQNQDPTLRLGQIRGAARILNGFIDGELARLGVGEEKLALVGFSQGTMMSLFTAPRRDKACAGIMGYSGRLEAPELLEKEIRSRPPVVLVHGDRDELLHIELLDQAASTLEANGVAVETYVRPGLGHGIDEVGLQVGMRFLEKVLADQ